MAYKKYFHKNGKKYGPYYYESYRDSSGKVKKKYVGTTDPNEKKKVEKKILVNKSFLSKFFIISVIVLAVVVGLFFISNLTGRASLDMQTSYMQGENISGILVLRLEQGEFIHTGSELIANLTSEKHFLITDLLPVRENRNIYYESNSDIGYGYGSSQEIEINLQDLGILAESGLLNIKLVYRDEVIAEASQEISVESEVLAQENLTIINETIIETNESITTKQYKVIINRPVKYIKKINANSSDFLIEINKLAENITIKTGQEVAESEKEIDEYNFAIESRNSKIKTSLITGNAVKVSGKGILSRIWKWFTITGNVIQESELGNSITETIDSKFVDVSDFAEDVGYGQESEIGVEYYTSGPVSVETNLSNGKRIVVSADDKLNYTNILAYIELDNRISVNESSKIKLYWKTTRAEAIEYGYLNEATENQEEISEEVEEGIIISNETQEQDEELINNSVIDEDKEKGKDKEDKNKTKEEKEKSITGKVISDEGYGYGLSEEIIEEEVENNLNENVSVEVSYDSFDLDGDNLIDYIEWNVPHLSEQVYEIIYITKADELDANKTFIRDVYEQVKGLDGNYTTIVDGNYLRVSFEQNLTNTKDITIYARDYCNVSIEINGIDVPCEIYEKKKRIDELRGELG